MSASRCAHNLCVSRSEAEEKRSAFPGGRTCDAMRLRRPPSSRWRIAMLLAVSVLPTAVDAQTATEPTSVGPMCCRRASLPGASRCVATARIPLARSHERLSSFPCSDVIVCSPSAFVVLSRLTTDRRRSATRSCRRRAPVIFKGRSQETGTTGSSFVGSTTSLTLRNASRRRPTSATGLRARYDFTLEPIPRMLGALSHPSPF